MVKTLARGRQYMTDAYWSAVGFASAAMLSIHPVFVTGNEGDYCFFCSIWA